MRFLWICVTIAALFCSCSQDQEPSKQPAAGELQSTAKPAVNSPSSMEIRPAAEYLAFDASHPWVSPVAEKLREELILGIHLPDCHLSLYSIRYVERLGAAPAFELTGGLVLTGPSVDLTFGAVVEGFRESGPLTHCSLVSLRREDSTVEGELRAPYVFRCSVRGLPAQKLADSIDNGIQNEIGSDADRERMWELILRSGSTHPGLKRDAIRELRRLAHKDRRDAIRALCLLALKTCRGSPIEVLGALRDRKSVPILISILSGTETGLKAAAAAEALGIIGDGRAVPVIIERLKADIADSSTAAKGPGPRTRTFDTAEAAAYALGLIGDKRAVPVLIEHLKTGSARAADALNSLGAYEEAFNALIHQLKTGNMNARLVAVRTLGKLGWQKAVSQLVNLLSDPDDSIVLEAVDTLHLIGGPAVDKLVEAMKHKSPQVRRHVSLVLKKIGDPRAVEPFIKALKDEDSYVRMDAAEALGSLDDFRAVGPLTEALIDVNKEVRYAAAWALGRLGDSRAVRFLISTLTDKDATLRSYAAQSLQMITREDFGDDYDKWMKWYSASKNK